MLSLTHIFSTSKGKNNQTQRRKCFFIVSKCSFILQIQPCCCCVTHLQAATPITFNINTLQPALLTLLNAVAIHVQLDLVSPKPQLICECALVEQIRYSQGTTEELRFFSLLLSLWALKHSRKRVLHCVRSW